MENHCCSQVYSTWAISWVTTKAATTVQHPVGLGKQKWIAGESLTRDSMLLSREAIVTASGSAAGSKATETVVRLVHPREKLQPQLDLVQLKRSKRIDSVSPICSKV